MARTTGWHKSSHHHLFPRTPEQRRLIYIKASAERAKLGLPSIKRPHTGGDQAERQSR